MGEQTMKALVYRAPGEYGLDDVAVPRILDPSDVIGRITLSTICASDIHIVHGHIPNAKPPKVIGHEFCAEIVEVGTEVTELKPGDRVHVMPGVYCGECIYCKMGVPVMCQHKDGGCFGNNGVDGCQAEFIRIPFAERFCMKIPQGLTEKDVILLGDMLATARFGIENAQLKAGQTLAVIGVGPVGLCTCLLAKKIYGAKQVIAIDPLQYRLDIALQQGIADVIINPAADDLMQKFMAATGGGVDVTIETAGLAETLQQAFTLTRPAGVVSNLAVHAAPVSIPIPEATVKNLTLRSGIQDCEGCDEMMTMIKDGIIDTSFLLTHEAPLNDILKGYEIFGQKKDGCIKWLITPYER